MDNDRIVADVPKAPGQDPREAWLVLRLCVLYLADHVRDAQLEDGHPLTDVTDFIDWLKLLAEKARQFAKPGALVQLEAPRSLRQLSAGSFRHVASDYCPDCGHIHIDDDECGFPTGGGRICRCRTPTLIAQTDDPELLEWLCNAKERGGHFISSIASAALVADHENYPLIRLLLLYFRIKYPAYEPSDAVKQEIRERGKPEGKS